MSIITKPKKIYGPDESASLHGKWCTITMTGSDMGFAQVNIITSNKTAIMFQYMGRIGMVAKKYIKYIEEARISKRRIEKNGELLKETWDDATDPFKYFEGRRVDIHVHQTRLFEHSAGYFAARIEYAGKDTLRIRENSKVMNIKKDSICGLVETIYE